jgi:hypothetical protein
MKSCENPQTVGVPYLSPSRYLTYLKANIAGLFLADPRSSGANGMALVAVMSDLSNAAMTLYLLADRQKGTFPTFQVFPRYQKGH